MNEPESYSWTTKRLKWMNKGYKIYWTISNSLKPTFFSSTFFVLPHRFLFHCLSPLFCPILWSFHWYFSVNRNRKTWSLHYNPILSLSLFAVCLTLLILFRQFNNFLNLWQFDSSLIQWWNSQNFRNKLLSHLHELRAKVVPSVK